MKHRSKKPICQFSTGKGHECGAVADWKNTCTGLRDTFFCQQHRQELELDATFPGQWFPIRVSSVAKIP